MLSSCKMNTTYYATQICIIGGSHAGLGIALVPTTALPARFAGIVTPLRPPLQRRVVVMVGTQTDALTRRFVDDLVARGMGARRH